MKRMVDMLENFSAVCKKIWGGAFALFLAFYAPLSSLAQDVPAHNPDGLISISGTVERTSTDELAIKPLTGSEVMTVKLVQPFHLYARVPGNLSHVKDTNCRRNVGEATRWDGAGIRDRHSPGGAAGRGRRKLHDEAERRLDAESHDERDGVSIQNVEWQRQAHGRNNADGPVSRRGPENHSACRYARSRVSTHCDQTGRGRQDISMGTESL
jgi:hypothetical protein